MNINRDMTYNHAFTLGFAVAGSKHADWRDTLRDPEEKSAVIEALYKRIRLLETDDLWYQSAIEGYDDYEEDN